MPNATDLIKADNFIFASGRIYGLGTIMLNNTFWWLGGTFGDGGPNSGVVALAPGATGKFYTVLDIPAFPALQISFDLILNNWEFDNWGVITQKLGSSNLIMKNGSVFMNNGAGGI